MGKRKPLRKQDVDKIRHWHTCSPKVWDEMHLDTTRAEYLDIPQAEIDRWDHVTGWLRPLVRAKGDKWFD